MEAMEPFAVRYRPGQRADISYCRQRKRRNDRTHMRQVRNPNARQQAEPAGEKHRNRQRNRDGEELKESAMAHQSASPVATLSSISTTSLETGSCVQPFSPSMKITMPSWIN